MDPGGPRSDGKPHSPDWPTHAWDPGQWLIARLRIADLVGVLAALTLLAIAAPASAAEPSGKLLGRAVLPFDTAAPGPPSGAALGTGPFNGVTAPFATQPVQGFSGILPAGEGVWLAMPDNGFGRKENSADWLLRVYRVRVGFETASGGDGVAGVEGYIELQDPNAMLPFPLVRPDRLLTGADVDPESIFEDSDGSFWVGDEFGPWMLHFDAGGRLLEPPISVPGVKSPQNPDLAPGEAPTLDRSKGFEAAAPSANGRRAYVFLEGALISDADQRRRYVYELDLDEGRFTGRVWAYRTEDPTWLVADAKLLDGHRLLVMERDDFEGTGVRFKKVFEVELGEPGPDRFVSKRSCSIFSTCAIPTRSRCPRSRATAASVSISPSRCEASRASGRSPAVGS